MHLPTLFHTLQGAISGEAAKRYVAEISRHHRVQASPGYRAAAEWLAATLQAHGLQAEIERFPATAYDHFWAQPSFQEWRCQTATLDWLRGPGEAERMCDFRAMALAVIQRSEAVNGEFQVIDVGDGQQADYEGRDVAGKLVLSRAAVRDTYRRAVAERGAAGILFDHIDATVPGRSRADLPDARQYASFWWQPELARSWGFVLSPRQGDAIRAALTRGETVHMAAHIEAEFVDGEFEVVVATLPASGEDEQAVLGLAHLCHPQGFANDNASGAACLLETALTLARLVASGELPPPRRTLTFLWMPEMTGTFAWLSAHADAIPSFVAGINLDMVGERQETTGSAMLIERPPEAMASFAPILLERMREELFHEQSSHGHTDGYPLFRHAVVSFSGGSDHAITSDPAVGIPTPMLLQWPDRFYHTTADTLEHVDPRSLQRAGAVAGSYLYWLAQAGPREARWLGWEMVARYERRLSRESQDEATRLLALRPSERSQGWRRLNEVAAFRQERAVAALQTLGRLADVDAHLPGWRSQVEEITGFLLDHCRQQIQPGAESALVTETAAAADPEASLIPVRHYRGPMMEMMPPLSGLGLDDEDAAAWSRLHEEISDWESWRQYAEFWADGRRTLAEIARLVELETGRALGPAFATYFRLLEKAGLVRMEGRA
ncbi:MAG: DUF4910 domain-containing protein [Caldilineales bacterium]|nr:DUF4910 domain-containing protein [Caldilineales bacterium]